MKGHVSLNRIKFYPQLREYELLASQFVNYLHMTDNAKISIEGLIRDKGRIYPKKKDIPYVHRWTECYLASRLAKLYKLEAWVKDNPVPVTMATYTTYHDYNKFGRLVNNGYSIEQCFRLLNEGLRNSIKLLRKMRGGVVNYIAVWEPHESGYPHVHVMFLTRLTDAEQEKLRLHWSEVLGVGDYEHGLNFSVDSVFQEGEITSIRNYLMKYMAKTLYDGWRDWTPAELVFNAIAWGGKRDVFKKKRHYRTFQPSRELSRVMAPDDERNPWEMWVRTSIKGHEPVLLRETENKEYRERYDRLRGES